MTGRLVTLPTNEIHILANFVADVSCSDTQEIDGVGIFILQSS